MSAVTGPAALTAFTPKAGAEVTGQFGNGPRLFVASLAWSRSENSVASEQCVTVDGDTDAQRKLRAPIRKCGEARASVASRLGSLSK